MDYTDLYNFQTSSGIVVPNDKSVLVGIQTKFQEIFGTDIDLSAETPVGRLIEAMAVVVKSTLGVTAQTANQFNVNVATGIYLDAIAQIYDLKRIAGTRTKINVRAYFSQASTDAIPAGSLIMSSVNGEMFAIDSTISNTGKSEVLPNGETRFYADGSATAVNVGPVIAAEGTVTSIQSAVIGWIGVTNIAPTYTGTDIETDEAFRKRILASRPIGIGFDTHLVSALNRLDGVYSNCVLENNTSYTMIKQDVAIPAHSIFVGIDCIETDELLNSIAEEIARAKPVGTGMVNADPTAQDAINIGGTRFQIDVPYGYNNAYSQPVCFYKAQQTPVYVSINYSQGNYSGGQIEADIIEVTAEYMASVGTGGTAYATMIANALINKLNIGVGTILLARDGSTTPADIKVQMAGYEVPLTNSEYITLNLID